MALLESKNYAKLQANSPSKIDPAEFNGRSKGQYDSYTLPGVVLADADEIDSMKIPEGAIITDAYIKCPSLGSTGIVNLGLRAFEDIDENSIPEDGDGLVAAADAGGQAVMKRASTEALLGKKVGKGGAQVFVLCSEVSTNTDVKIEWFVEYLLP